MKNRLYKRLIAIFAIQLLCSSIPAYAFEMQDINDLKKKVEERQKSGDFGLSNDFFEQNYHDELQMLDTNLEDAQRKYDFSFKMEALEEEYEKASYKFKDDQTYVIANKGDDSVKYVLSHMIICSTKQLKAEPGRIVITDASGEKNVAEINLESDEIQIENGVVISDYNTTGREICLNNKEEFFTPDANLNGNDLIGMGVCGIWKATLPFFWQNTEVVEEETEAEEKESENSLPEKVNMAIGMVTSGEYYLFYSEEGAPPDDIAIMFANYGCIYATGIYGNGITVNGQLLKN